MDLLRKVSTPFKTLLLTLTTLLLLSACGGSGSDSTGGGSNPGAATIVVTTSNSSVTATSPATITASVSNSLGAVSGVVVTFNTTLGNFDPEQGTALTDANGVATIVLTAGDEAGAGTITASIESGESGTVSFQTAGDETVGGISLNLSISNSSITAATPATITAIVSDSSGALGDQLITFTSTLGVLDPISGTVLTNASGVATIVLNAGDTAGAGAVTATLSGDVSETINFETAGDGSIGGTSLVLSISTTNVSAATPATVTAIVSDNSGPLSNQVVTFTSTLGVLNPLSGTALSDVNGIATIQLTAGTVAGAGIIAAELISGENESLAFQTAGDDVAAGVAISLVLVSAQTGLVTDTISPTEPGKIIATVSGVNNKVLLTFAITQGIAGEIPIPTAITDDNNQAVVDIFSGSELGAIEVTASLQSGESGSIPLTVGATNLNMGSGIPFVPGVASVSATEISAGATAVVSVQILDDNGVVFTDPVAVNFSSRCTNLTPPEASLDSPVTTVNGVASSIYLAQGCVDEDLITVTANAGGINLIASASINVLAADAGSIEFVSVENENIVLKGAGGLGSFESSKVEFRVRDKDGNPVSGQDVTFELNTDVGGITMSQSTATSQSDGLVQTVINSGTVATTVRVTASFVNVDGQTISTQSSNLVISTGLPDQDSFSLSADILNPEGWDIDGTAVNVTARLSDAFNNPVPDGTTISFTTEGGSIQSSCLTAGGVCSVVWTSQNPRPEGETLVDNGAVPELQNTLGQKYGGRATILATAIGEESFPDLNGNGRFDEGAEVTAFAGNDTSGNPFDLDEAFVDHNEDNVYNPSVGGGQLGGTLETFADFNGDSNFTLKDGKYNGVLCSIPAHAGCSDTQKSLNVRANLVLVMSGSNPSLVVTNTLDAPNIGAAEDGDSSLIIVGESTGSASVIIADLHNQPMPAGTTITFTATVGSIVGPSEFTWPNDNHNGGRAFGVSVKGAAQPDAGTLIIEVLTPGGLNTVFSPITISIQ